MRRASSSGQRAARRLNSPVPRAVAIAIAVVVLLGVVALVILTAVGAFAGTSDASGSSAGSTGHGGHREYYVSLGDSYAVGFQPLPAPGPTSGFTGFVASKAHMTLVNFGCGGATTTSILHTDGCAPPYGPQAGTGAASYPSQTQAAAAEAFIAAHRKDVGLVTVSIGGNDLTHCAVVAKPTTCALTAVSRVRANVTALAKGLRAAAGGRVPIVGLTYPDVLLGLWVYPVGHPNASLASLSVTAFKRLFNPALESAYGAAHGIFVDVTAATGAYVPLSRTTTLAPYGTVPIAVARVCHLTWYCADGNIHAKAAGYRAIGGDIIAALRERS